MIRAPGARSDKFFCKPRASGDDPRAGLAALIDYV